MIHFDNLEFDLGTVTYGQSLSAKVNITNNGSQSVMLTPNNASCSCTSGSLDYSTLQAGGKGVFIITLNTQKAGKGQQAKSINLSYTVGTTTNSQVFRIKANVI
jgi:hypothetical protein